MANPELNDLEGNGKKRVNAKRMYFAIFLILFLTIPMGYYIWMRNHRNDLCIIERDEWGAEEPIAKDFLNLPAQNVIIYHTATEQCETKDVCIHRMQMVQDFHMRDREWHDIGLNFLVGGDGGIYEGRGWDVRAQPLRGYESESISIAFIGTFSNVEPQERQIKAAKRLMEDGVRRKKLRQAVADPRGGKLGKFPPPWNHRT